MYKKILVPLDGSQTAESVLPFARCFARGSRVPVQLIAAVDMPEITRSVSAAEALFLDSLIARETQRYGNYLEDIAKNFPAGTAQWTVAKGNAANVIIEAAAADKGALIAMATHGRSGLNRWLLGSVAEKVLRAGSNPLLLVRGRENAPRWDMAALKYVVVPLDGSELAERVLPSAEVLARELDLEMILLRVYGVPYGAYASGDGFFNTSQIQALISTLRDEAVGYLEKKAADLKRKGVAKVSFVAKEGLASDEIISFARQLPDNVIAMSSHGRSGVKRWALGSVAETVVRHSGNPVLVVRASS